MASNFPSSLDTFTNPSSTDAMDSVSVPHATQHSDLNDAVEALQAKVGADSSGVSSSHDYKIAALEAVSHGKILQVVSTLKTDTFSTTNSSFTDVTGLSVTITPTSASSKVLIVCQLAYSYSGTGSMHIQLAGGNTASYVGDTAGSRVSAVSGLYTYTNFRADLSLLNSPLIYLDSPATTSATTYKAQIRRGSVGTVYINRSYEDFNTAEYTRGASTITVMEVSA
jgi:hypothetical protein